MAVSDRSVRTAISDESAAALLALAFHALGMAVGGSDHPGRPDQQPALALFSEYQQPLPYFFRLHGNGFDDVAMVFIIITGNIDLSVASNAGHERFVHGFAASSWVSTSGSRPLAGLIAGYPGWLAERLPHRPCQAAGAGSHAGYFRILSWHRLRAVGDQAARGYPACLHLHRPGKGARHTDPFASCSSSFWPWSLGLVLHKTTFGRYLYAIGNNENATSIPACQLPGSN